MDFHSPPNIYVQHVHLKVSNLNQSILFYRDKLGLTVLSKNEKQATLTANGIHPLIIIEETDSALPNTGRKTGLYHFALLLPSRKDLANVLSHLIESRYPLQGASDHLVSEAIYLADPDNHGIELYVDRPQEKWYKYDGTVEMTTNRLDIQDLLAERSEEPYSKISPETIIGHIHLQVSEIKDSEEFYNLLGFKEVNRYGLQALFISTGGYHHHIGLNTWNSAGSPAPLENELSMKTFTLKFPNEQIRRVAIDNLREFGANVTQIDKEYFTFDPSQNKMILSIEERFLL